MISKNIYMNIGFIDPKFIEKAAPAEAVHINQANNHTNKTKKRNKNGWIGWVKIAACLCLILCAIVITKYSRGIGPFKRISFNNQTLGELEEHINDNTMVVFSADTNLPDKLPIYKISKRNISEAELNKTLRQLGVGEDIESSKKISLDGNKIGIMLKSLSDSDDEFNLTDDELEKLALETFNKLAFVHGEYKYSGIKATNMITDSAGTRTTSVVVSFRRMLDDVGIIGEDQCLLYFDSTGLVRVFARLYDYKEIGTMDLVPLESASSRVKQPDSFSIDTAPDEAELGMLDKLEVKKITLMYVNQYSDGCTILEPVYSYSGTATDINGKTDDFNSKIIAIPDHYTYES